MSSDTQSAPAQPELSISTQYTNVLDARFITRALRARHVRGASWSTDARLPADAPGVLATASYDYDGSSEALVELEGAVAHVIRRQDRAVVRLAAEQEQALDRAERALRDALPPPPADNRERITLDFTHFSDGRLNWTSRTLETPSLERVVENYAHGVRESLARLGSGFVPGRGGRLILWHGPPGCGKTFALKTLGWEWREWCSLTYVTDPEVLLNTPGYLMNLLHTDSESEPDRWRLLVLEDTGELLGTDARNETGQGLSRLLNAVDGLLGASTRTLVLITTNEDLRAIHPAVARPGRCAQLLEFTALDVAEANAWLKRAGTSERVFAPPTLAELYAIRDGQNVETGRRHPVGFAPPAQASVGHARE